MRVSQGIASIMEYIAQGGVLVTETPKRVALFN